MVMLGLMLSGLILHPLSHRNGKGLEMEFLYDSTQNSKALITIDSPLFTVQHLTERPV